MQQITDLQSASKTELRDALLNNQKFAHEHPDQAEDCLAYARKIGAEIRRRIAAVRRRLRQKGGSR